MRKHSVSATLWMIIAMTQEDRANAADASAAAPPNATSYIDLSFEGACDTRNQRLYLKNRHEFKTIAVALRWHAEGGKDLAEQFFAAPRTNEEIGCAVSAEIVEAALTDF